MSSVLIIDDEAGIRFALRRWFERQGWTVQEAADGEEALACLKGVSDDGDDRFDLVICDVNLPRRSGGSLVSVLKAERPATAARVVLTTGDDIEGAAPGSLLQGYPNVLQKPFDFNTLRSIVDHMTGRIG